MLVECLKEKTIDLNGDKKHLLNKSQRYAIIRVIFRNKNFDNTEKYKYLDEEMTIDYTDIDEKQKMRCISCLPED